MRLRCSDATKGMSRVHRLDGGYAMIRKIFQLLPISVRRKKYLKFIFFFTASRLGIVQRPALNDLDLKLEKYLPYSGGVFIEAGANDGISQSNTWYFETYRGWSGLLIEPIPELAQMAIRFRKSPVANVALCGRNEDGSLIYLSVNDLMTKVADAEKGNIKVKARALSNLLDDYKITKIDLFSLDVEGFEINVLDGLNLDRHAPNFILVETADIDAVLLKLQARYELLEKLSFHDYLLQHKASRGTPAGACNMTATEE
jgi:FkbM family methyltransferase